MAKRNKKARIIQVDFTDVEVRKVPPAGVYNFKIDSVDVNEGQGYPYLSVRFSVLDGEYQGSVGFNNFSMNPRALWRLRELLQAVGEDVPSSVYEFEVDELIDAELTCEVENETYEGKRKLTFSGFMPLNDDGEDDDEEEEGDAEEDDAADAEGEEDEDDEDEEEDDEVEEDDEEDEEEPEYDPTFINKATKAELYEIVNDEALDESLLKVKGIKALRKGVIEALQEDGLLDEE